MTNIDFTDLSYCGEEANKIFSQQVYNLPVYEYITLMDGVKTKKKIYNGETGDLWKEYTCAFEPSGSVVLTEDYIETKPIDMAESFCYDVFWDNFLVEGTRISMNGGIPPTFSEWFFDRLKKEMDKEYVEMFWRGDEDYSGATKTYLSLVDGVEKQLDEKVPSGNTIAGSVFTVSNIIAQVEAAIMKSLEVAADAEVETENFKIMMNHNDVRLLEVALGKDCTCNNSGQIFNNYARANGKIYVMGFEVIETVQSRNTIIVGPSKNLVLGFDSFDAKTQYVLKDMRQSTLDNEFRVRAITNIGVGILYPSLFVVSKP